MPNKPKPIKETDKTNPNGHLNKSGGFISDSFFLINIEESDHSHASYSSYLRIISYYCGAVISTLAFLIFFNSSRVSSNLRLINNVGL